MAEKQSPLRASPLRLPGQSIESRREQLRDDKLLLPMIWAGVFTIVALVEWYRFLVPQAPSPWVYTAFALVAIGYAAYSIWKILPEMRALRLARDGERAVGQFLEQLREDGYQVFHDVMGTGFNIDHVLIGPTGVISVETKTFSRRVGPDATVKFDGQSILVDGWKPDRDPVIQAKAQANWLGQLLEESTGRKFPVRPVVLFPGWYVEQGPGALKVMWVLNPKAMRAFLANQPKVLQPEDIKLASFHLSRFVRAGEAP